MSRAVRWYGVLALGWSALAAVLAAGFSVRYLPALEDVVALQAVAWAVLVVLWLIMLMPVGIAVGAPLVSRLRRRDGGGAPRRPGSANSGEGHR